MKKESIFARLQTCLQLIAVFLILPFIVISYLIFGVDNFFKECYCPTCTGCAE